MPQQKDEIAIMTVCMGRNDLVGDVISVVKDGGYGLVALSDYSALFDVQ
ncbi:MAG: hypothetical protein ACLTZM_02535 [Ruminococcus sp.]